MSYATRILCDSVTTRGHETNRLTTFEVTIPRIVLAEFNTHRMLSRNSASSRAIPVKKRIQAILDDPFIPESFGKNQKGMQAGEQLDVEAGAQAQGIWLEARDAAARYAASLADLEVHKQLANRLLEPFLWHTIIVSATEWDNLWALRCHPAAQPEIRKPIEMMRDAYDDAIPMELRPGQWHLPLVNDEAQLRADGFSELHIKMISVGRCARVSYLTHDGHRDPHADIELCARLQASGHMSPFEHVARPLTDDDVAHRGLNGWRPFVGNYCGWVQYRKEIPNEDNFKRVLLAR